MNIVLEGISAVGKTYLGKKLAKRWGMKFIEFMPTDEDWGNEVKLHQDIIDMHRNDMSIIETSVIGSHVIKEFMYQEGTITMADLIECRSLDTSGMKPYIVIYLQDTYQSVIDRRADRGREFEFNPEYSKTTQRDLDMYIDRHLPDRLSKAGIPSLYVNLSMAGDGDAVLDYIERLLFEYLRISSVGIEIK